MFYNQHSQLNIITEIQKQVTEMKEIYSRKSSLMVFNLPENSKDTISVTDICKKFMNISLTVIEATRIGRKNSNRIRPLKIKFRNNQERNYNKRHVRAI